MYIEIQHFIEIVLKSIYLYFDKLLNRGICPQRLIVVATDVVILTAGSTSVFHIVLG